MFCLNLLKDTLGKKGTIIMLFNSWAFAIFLPIVFICYWVLPHKFRWMLLLVASYYFYMSWNAKYIMLILFTTLISYVTARLLEQAGGVAALRISGFRAGLPWHTILFQIF